MGIYVKFWHFYDARSPNMAMSRDPKSKFRKKKFFLNSAFNIGKSCKISGRKALYFRSYQPKTSRGGRKHLPSAFRVKKSATLSLQHDLQNVLGSYIF